MKIKVSIIAGLLALCTLVSCTGGNDNGHGDDTSGNAPVSSDGLSDSNSTSAPIVTTVDPLANVPIDDYQNYVFNICVTKHGWAKYSMVTEESTDNLSNTIFKRNLNVEGRLNISIEQQEYDAATIESMVKAQALVNDANNFDAIWQALTRINNQVQQGCIADLATYDELTLDSSDWWYGSFNDSISIGDRRYCAMGDLNLVYHSGFGVCAFNKSLFKDYDSETNLYTVYKNGEWTWERMFEYMQKASDDKNGDGKMLAGDDIYGLAMHYNALKSFLSSSGMMIVKKDNNGIPYYDGVDQRFGEAFVFVVDKIANPLYSIIPDISSGYGEYSSGGGSYTNAFNEGRALFFLESTGAISRIRSGSIDYGIVGYPKYDEKSDYHSPIYYAVSSLCTLANDLDPERTGTILENLCAYSHGTVETAYRANVLYYRYANDEESSETLAKAFETGICDMAYIYNWASMLNRVEDAQKARKTDYVTLFQKAEAPLNTAIKNTLIYYGIEK